MMEMGSTLKPSGRFGADSARGEVQQETEHSWGVK